jgi:hypothetical protein
MATTGALSDYAENKLLDHLLGVAVFTPPVPYLALLTSASTDAVSGTEIADTWYARKTVPFGPASIGSSPNNTTVDFGIVANVAVDITHWAIFDAITAGNMLVYGDFSNPQIASPGNHVIIPIASLNVSAD